MSDETKAPIQWEELLTRWQPQLDRLPEEKIRTFSTPVHIYVNEAHQFADAAQEYYEPRDIDGQQRPGLRAVSFRFPHAKIQEIHELADLVAYLQAIVLFGKTSALTQFQKLLDRANFLTDELGDALEFHLDDDIEEHADKELANIQLRAKEIGNSASATSELLLAYALLADSLRDRLQQDGTFNIAWIQEAKQIANELNKTPRLSAKDARPFIQLRERARTLLYENIHLLRKAVNRVFRNDQDVKRKFSSTYERNRRAQQRALKNATSSTDATATTTPTADATVTATPPTAATPTTASGVTATATPPTAAAPAAATPTVHANLHDPKNPK